MLIIIIIIVVVAVVVVVIVIIVIIIIIIIITIIIVNRPKNTSNEKNNGVLWLTILPRVCKEKQECCQQSTSSNTNVVRLYIKDKLNLAFAIFSSLLSNILQCVILLLLEASVMCKVGV